jgi:hypothetical protein
MKMLQTLPRLLPALAVLLALAAGSLPTARARGGAAAPPAANPADGAVFFNQAIRYVNGGHPGIHRLTDFYADLYDVHFDVGKSKLQGFMRLWLKTPDKYRLEMRETQALSGPGVRVLSTKILNGDRMWVLQPNQPARRVHGTAGGQATVEQMKDDRKRLMDLARFLTLDGLEGPGVTFVNEGFTVGNGAFAGSWLRIRRRIVGGADVVFYLAYQRTPQGVVATYPGVVKIEGDPRAHEPTEYYLLQKWRKGPQFNFPGKIEAISQAAPAAPMKRFLLAFPNDVRINTGLQSSIFLPPGSTATPGR